MNSLSSDNKFGYFFRFLGLIFVLAELASFQSYQIYKHVDVKHTKPKEEKTDVHTPGAEFGRDLAAAALAEAFIGGGRPPEHPPHPPHP